jgi:MFS family permease
MKLYPAYFQNLSINERNAFRLHFIYSILEGFVAGIFALNEYVFVKSLKGSNMQLGLLFQFSVVVYVFLILFNEILKRIQNKKKLLRITAIVTRLPLILLFLFPSSVQEVANSTWHYLFLAIFFVYFLASPVIFPAINLFLKNVYKHEHFGKLYSYATTWNKVVMLIVTFLYGMWLDADMMAFRYVFVFVALAGIGSVFILSKIEYKTKEIQRESLPIFKSIRSSITRMMRILKENRPYLHFEGGFMLYGFAFMISVTVITLYFDRALHLNYTSVAFYKNAYNIISILMIPFFGRLIGRIDPRHFAAITYSAIMLFILSLAMIEFFPISYNIWGLKLYVMMIPYVLFHSVFAATMALLWSIGSAYFCKSSDAGDYQSVHLSLTGMRALFAPTSGVIIYEWFGFFTTFIFAVIALAFAVLLMLWSYKKHGKIYKTEIK